MAVAFNCGRSAWLGISLRMLNKSQRAAFSTGKTLCCRAENGSEDTRVFAHHTFYKGKSALSMQPGRPIFKANKDGGFFLQKEGSMFLEFAPSTGPREYDWTRKQIFALSVMEMGSLVSLTMSESIEFYHDPLLGSSDAGKIRKNLKIEPMTDKNGFFFNFSVANKQENLDMRITVPLTKGEFAVMRSSFNFIIPYLMGWHAYANPSTIQFYAHSQVDPDLEWSK